MKRILIASALASVFVGSASAQVVKTEDFLQSRYLIDMDCKTQTTATFANGAVHGLGYNCFVPGVDIVTNNPLERAQKLQNGMTKKLGVQQFTASSKDKQSLQQFVAQLRAEGYTEKPTVDSMIIAVDNRAVKEASENEYFKYYRFYSTSYYPDDGYGPGRYRVGVFLLLEDKPCLYTQGASCDAK